MRTSKCAIIATAVLLFSAAPMLGASVGAASIGSVTLSVSGSYSNVTDYAGVIELAYGDLSSASYYDSEGPGATYVNLDHEIADYTHLKAYSKGVGLGEVSYHPPSGTNRPRLQAYSYVEVWDVWDWAWAHGIGEGIVGVWTPDVNQTVTVTATYRYGVSLVNAQPGDPLQPPYDQFPEVDIRLQVSMVDMSVTPGQEMLTPKGQWVGGAGMEIHRHGETVGYLDKSPSYPANDTTNWYVNVQAGRTYALWCRAEADARTPWLPEPATVLLFGPAAALLLKRRHR